MSKLKEKWVEYAASVPGLAAAVQPSDIEVDDSAKEYQLLFDTMPTDVAEQIQDTVKQDDEVNWPRSVEHHWCLCEMPEGEFPRIYIFPSLQRLAEAIAKREGKETACWAMYGVPLRLSQALNVANKEQAVLRYLLLPNQLAAVVSNTEPFALLSQDILPDSLETQDEGWMGDPTYLKDQSFYQQGYEDVDDMADVDDEQSGPDDDDFDSELQG